MKNVFVISDNIISPLGNTTEENFIQLKKNNSAIKRVDDNMLSSNSFFASVFENSHKNTLCSERSFSFFENLIIRSVKESLQNTSVKLTSAKTILIISSTKGNIGDLEINQISPELSLTNSAEKISDYFNCVNEPLIISNACISGITALIVARRLISSGEYENAVVTGADVLSKFIVSGFESFQALSPSTCAPFDAERKGLNLGEGVATIILSSVPNEEVTIRLSGGAITNDANHISGPSRTGDELSHAINCSLSESGLDPCDIHFISSHGTATIYNDEMEAKAFTSSGVSSSPVNSLKGYFGHTLGAAGILESVISIHSMKENIILPSKGFNKSGVTVSLNVCTEIKSGIKLENILKTGSGFGGCNAVIIFSKN